MSEKAPSFFFQVNSTNLQRFSRRSVYFSRPSLLRLYEIEDGKIYPAKKLQYFREPKLSEYPIDLNDSYETYRFSKLSNETKNLLSLQHEMIVSGTEKAIQNNARSNDRIERTSVYTRRGVLRYIMEFCYSGKYDNSILISRYDGKLYMFEVHGELQDFEKKPVFTHHSRLCRQLFVDEPNGLPNTDEPYDICDTQHILHRSNLGKFDITYSGEVKGIISDVKLDKINDINVLKKKRFAMTKQMWLHLKNHDLKFLNYWTQGYLANVEDLYMAYKDKNGVVREPIEHLKVSNIPKNRRWKPGVCTAFLNEFLERVEQLMWNVNSFETVYEFHFKGQEKTIHYEIHTGNPEKIAIPKEYIAFAKKQGR